MILHIFNRPEAFTREQRFIATGDTVLFIEDGVYVDDAALSQACYLDSDVHARGLASRRSADKLINHDDFVRLCIEATQVITWS